MSARPAIISTLRRISSMLMLSSRIDVGAAEQRVFRGSERRHFDLDAHRVADSAARAHDDVADSSEPCSRAAAMWLSLISTPEFRPKRWFWPPPQRTA